MRLHQKFKILCIKRHDQNLKRQPKEWGEKQSANQNPVSDQNPESKKKLLQILKKQKIKKWAKNLNISPKKIYKWPTSI